MTPEPRFSGLVLDHQGLEELELKNHPKTAVFDQIWLFDRFFGSGSFPDPKIPMGTLGMLE